MPTDPTPTPPPDAAALCAKCNTRPAIASFGAEGDPATSIRVCGPCGIACLAASIKIFESQRIADAAALRSQAAEIADLRALMPLLDKAGQGDLDQQARAWSMVYKALVKVGLESFIDRIEDTGAARATKFVLHLAAELERCRAALKPFAEYSLHLILNNDPPDRHAGYYHSPGVLVSDFIRAAEALAASAPQTSEGKK